MTALALSYSSQEEPPLLSLVRGIHPGIAAVEVKNTPFRGPIVYSGPTVAVRGPRLSDAFESMIWNKINESRLVNNGGGFCFQYVTQKTWGNFQHAIAQYRLRIQNVVDAQFGNGLVEVDVGMSIPGMISHAIGNTKWGIGLVLSLPSQKGIECPDRVYRRALQIVQGQILLNTPYWVADRIHWVKAGNIRRERQKSGEFVFSS